MERSDGKMFYSCGYRSAPYGPSTSQRRKVTDLECEIRTLILTSKTMTLGQEYTLILIY